MIALVGVGLVAGVVVSSVVADPGPTDRQARANGVAVPGGNNATAEPVATPAGAIEAAASYVCNARALLSVDPLSAEELIREASADEVASQQVEMTLRELDAFRKRLQQGSGEIFLDQAAIAYRLVRFEPTRARVAVWSVSVLARAGVASPQAGWSTSTLDLVWQRGGWRVESEQISSGPAPILNRDTPPATEEQLTTSLAGFSTFRAVP